MTSHTIKFRIKNSTTHVYRCATSFSDYKRPLFRNIRQAFCRKCPISCNIMLSNIQYAPNILLYMLSTLLYTPNTLLCVPRVLLYIPSTLLYVSSTLFYVSISLLYMPSILLYVPSILQLTRTLQIQSRKQMKIFEQANENLHANII